MKVLAGAMMLLALAGHSPLGEGQSGYWSPDAKKLYLERAISPDGTSSLALKGGQLVLTRQGVARSVETPYAPATVEALWSRDGRHVAVTGSDGGAAGTWSVTVLDSRGRDVGGALAKAVSRLGAGLARCNEPEALNVTAAGWARTGLGLVLRIEVPPHSSCTNMGEARFAIVEAHAWSGALIVPRSTAEADLGRALR